MIKLSTTSKLDGIKSWSLQAIETCPGSANGAGGLVDACASCYATTGTYYYPNVIATRAHNKEDWLRDAWVADMIAALETERYMRWFDSGDMYSTELAEKMYQVMAGTPWVKHWLPARSAKFAKFKDIIDRMQALDNVMVRFSSDSVMGGYTPGVHGSTIVPDGMPTPDGVKLCTAPTTGGKCSGCRACYDKSVPVIGYVGHGKRIIKVVRMRKEELAAA